MRNPRWETLGHVSPRGLSEARLLLHHAAQLVAAVGRCLLPPQADDGHTSLEWVAAWGCLAGQEVPGRRSWRVALRPGDLSLSIASTDGLDAARLALEGRTVRRARSSGSSTGRPTSDRRPNG